MNELNKDMQTEADWPEAQRKIQAKRDMEYERMRTALKIIQILIEGLVVLTMQADLKSKIRDEIRRGPGEE